ncbi:MAG: hypothetical protein IJ002_02115 [Clostridia bacterium]|nr:hypothetical protein [Clostridia bacterium]
MEKIKQKPIEKIKTVIIAVLIVTMLALACLYIGGAQFSGAGAAINAQDMPLGAVPAGEDAPKQTAVYEKNLLSFSFIGIRCGENGGGAYATEQAARDLFEIALEPLHALLSSSSTVEKIDSEQFESAAAGEKYICISLTSALPYQIIYALSGEYSAPFGSDRAISPSTLLISFDEGGNASLYMRTKDACYKSAGNCTFSLSELSAMASDARLYDFELSDGVAYSETVPMARTLTLSRSDTLANGALESILSLLDFGTSGTQPMAMADIYTAVAPHGNLHIGDGKVVYTAASEGGISLSSFLSAAKSDLDISLYDVLLSSVSLVESLSRAVQNPLDIYIDGFYRSDDVYTIVFGASENTVPLSGDAFPYLAKVTAEGGKLKSAEFYMLSADRSNYSVSPFSSAWEYRHASKSAKITTMGLRYHVDKLPANELAAAWYCTGERTVEK